MPAIHPSDLTKDLLEIVSLRRLRQQGFSRNVLVVMSGTAFAQVLSVAFSPILSRLYGPEAFGVYGSFASISGVLGAVATLQYAEALMLPDREDVAGRLFFASCLSACVAAFLFGLVTVFAPEFWLAVLKAPELRGWLWLIPLAGLVMGMNQTLTAWCARRKAFKRSAASQVVRSVTANGGQTTAGLAGLGGGGLIGGSLAGDILANLILSFWVWRDHAKELRQHTSASLILAAARDHKDFPLYSAPQTLLNALSQGAPVILLIHYFGAAVGGLYAFSARVLQMPMSFVLTSLRQVLFQKLTEVRHSGGDLPSLFVKCTGLLFALSILPAVACFAFAPPLFALVFGSEWYAAGEYARWLVVWFVPGFCNLPAVLIGRILRQQRNLLLFDVALLASRITVLVLGGTYFGPEQTIALFSLVGAVFNVVLIAFIWQRLAHAARTPPAAG